MLFPGSKHNYIILINKICNAAIQIKLISLKGLKAIKKTRVYVEDNTDTRKLVLKTNKATSSILFYHEGSMEIRLIKELALVTRKTYHLQELCCCLGINEGITQIKKSIDLEYIPSLCCIVVSFGTCIGLIPTCKDMPRIIHKTDSDQIRNIYYDSTEKLLLVLGTTSLSLFNIDAQGVTGSRVFNNCFLKMPCRVLGWDTVEGAIVLAQLTNRGRENFHLMRYCSKGIILKTSVINKMKNSSYYSKKCKTLFYVDDDCSQGKIIRGFPMSNARCDEEECIIEGEKVAVLPQHCCQAKSIMLDIKQGLIFARPLHY